MASTLTPTTFKVKIIEEHVVRNNVNKNEVVFEIGGVTNVDHRIVTCPNTTSCSYVSKSYSTIIFTFVYQLFRKKTSGGVPGEVLGA